MQCDDHLALGRQLNPPLAGRGAAVCVARVAWGLDVAALSRDLLELSRTCGGDDL